MSGGDTIKVSKKRFAQVWQHEANSYAYLLGVGHVGLSVVKIKYHQDGIVSTSTGKFSTTSTNQNNYFIRTNMLAKPSRLASICT